MNTKEIIETIKSNNIFPNKKLGQNFICNNSIVRRIIELSGTKKKDDILEIGPGLGDLTELLLEHANSVTSIEIDSGLYQFLKNRFAASDNLNLIHGDFLKLKINGNFTKVISNLPYYCSSEILFRLVSKFRVEEIYVMLQKEMAERIKANPGTKNYGALSVTLGLYYSSEILFKLDKKSFYPQPDVSSSFICLKRKKDTVLNEIETELFHIIVKSAFWGRRKTLKKSLNDSPHFSFNKEALLKALGENLAETDIRGEELTTEQFINITKTYSGYDRKKH